MKKLIIIFIFSSLSIAGVVYSSFFSKKVQLSKYQNFISKVVEYIKNVKGEKHFFGYGPNREFVYKIEDPSMMKNLKQQKTLKDMRANFAQFDFFKAFLPSGQENDLSFLIDIAPFVLPIISLPSNEYSDHQFLNNVKYLKEFYQHLSYEQIDRIFEKMQTMLCDYLKQHNFYKLASLLSDNKIWQYMITTDSTFVFSLFQNIFILDDVEEKRKFILKLSDLIHNYEKEMLPLSDQKEKETIALLKNDELRKLIESHKKEMQQEEIIKLSNSQFRDFPQKAESVL
ncbi:hypothetical protein HYV11_00145 [Candidatus Dependentiae bacterium]|nr:hypothetical protein [Candidatus Dependentiae bacterium]